MPRTQIPSEQIDDQGVTRVDLNVDTPGSAVIAKIIAGSNLSITETGADAGTGDVTISAVDGSSRTYFGISSVGSSSILMMQHGSSSSIPTTTVPIIFGVAATLTKISIVVNKVEPAKEYTLALYNDARNTPVWVADLVVIAPNTLRAENTALSVPLTAVDDYAIGLRLTGAGSGTSKFSKMVVVVNLG